MSRWLEPGRSTLVRPGGGSLAGIDRRVRWPLAPLLGALLSIAPGIPVHAQSPEIPEGSGWGRVPFRHGLRAPLGISGMDAVAAGPSGFVAIGQVPLGAAAWWSTDGLDWHRARTPQDWRARTAWRFPTLTDIVSTDAGFVVVGRTTAGSGAVWGSQDGRSWERLAAGLGPGLATIVSAGGVLIAAGPDRDEDGSRIWASGDLKTWTAVATLDGIGITSLAAGPLGLVAAGETFIEDVGRRAVVLRSTDGVEWLPSPIEPASETFIQDVAAFGDGWVAVGAMGEGEPESGAAWRSVDGESWLQAPAIDSWSTPRRSVWVEAVAVRPEGDLVATGPGVDGQIVAWRSADGLAWEPVAMPVEDPDLGGTYEPADIAAGTDRTVIVGSYPDVGYPYEGLRRWSAAVWTSPAPPDAGEPEEWRTRCPGRGARLAGILDLRPDLRIRCFGRRPLSFRAWLGDAPYDGDEIASRPDWLTTVFAAGYAYPARIIGWLGDFLILHVAPGSGLPAKLGSGRWVRITGHFDDPAARRAKAR